MTPLTWGGLVVLVVIGLIISIAEVRKSREKPLSDEWQREQRRRANDSHHF